MVFEPYISKFHITQFYL